MLEPAANEMHWPQSVLHYAALCRSVKFYIQSLKPKLTISPISSFQVQIVSEAPSSRSM